ncbi:glycosyltransferase [Azospirillum brasilense]|uniref:glycosyltransferase family 2 protein n=1 Tax=Azospirillum brasilense TaxID=192 RepID=UPI001EDC179C|nr:cellulose synthase catalytic subunit [Azospirillum brasilense]UKJ76524.1 glycosyltransferase [Azospirillum brasilense]
MVLSPFEASFAPSLLVCGAALAILPFCRPDNSRVRVVLFTLCIVLGWRYIAWRFAESIPPLAFNAEAIGAWAFALLEAATTVSSTLAFALMSRVKNRSGEADQHAGWWRPTAPPQLDVLITTYNEEEAILARTIGGALGIDHPNLRVWVLDDGKRDWLQDLCARKGCHYLQRPDNSHAKAGNINHALKHLATLSRQPDFVVVLDADFVPHSNFVTRALALFHDPSVGLVQTPQHFFNPDPIQSNLRIGRAYPDEQRFFFDHLLASRDAWGIAFCCGTSSMMRWEGLQAIGGFPTDSVTEDFLVTIRLKERGWRTVYLNERLSDGLAPEGLKEYVTQRGRWCLGMIQIFRGPSGPFSKNPLSLIDRVGLIDSFLYWGVTFPFRFACLFAPILYWWFGISIVNATAPDVITYFVPYFLAAMIALNWTTRGQIIPLLHDVSQMLTMFEIIQAVAVGLVKPKGHKFKVTAKGGQRDRVTVQWGMMRRFGLLAAATAGGMIYAGLADYAPQGGAGDGKVIVLFWSFYNLAALALAMAVCIELPRYRQDERFWTDEQADIELVGRETTGRTRRMRVLDISLGGLRMWGMVDAVPGAPVLVHIEGVGPVQAVLVGQADGAFTLRFIEDAQVRDRLIRKLYSGRYSGGARSISLEKILTGLRARATR